MPRQPCHQTLPPSSTYLWPAAKAGPVFVLEEVWEAALLLTGHHLVEGLVLLPFAFQDLQAHTGQLITPALKMGGGVCPRQFFTDTAKGTGGTMHWVPCLERLSTHNPSRREVTKWQFKALQNCLVNQEGGC